MENKTITKYEVLKGIINQSIQNSGLDIGAVYFIMKDIYSNIENLYYSQLNREAIENAERQRQEQLNKENVTENEAEEV